MEEESTAYLKFLQDPTATLLTTSIELSDALPFTEIGSSDWQTEAFPVLITPDTDIELLSERTVLKSNGVSGESILVRQEDEVESSEDLPDYLPLEEGVAITESLQNSVTITEEDVANSLSKKTYINYSPIVKENPDGNKEIYLTEKDINNDASVIQLFNTDGSVITIDKAVLSSLNFPQENGVSQSARNYEPHYCPVIAYKCKVCSCLCDSETVVKRHIDEKHGELFHQEVPIQSGQSLLKKRVENVRKYAIYLCSLCKTAFSEKEKLKEHMISSHKLVSNGDSSENVQNDPSANSAKSLKTFSSFLLKQQEKARRKVVCSVEGCKLRFPRNEICQKHEECHVGDNRRQFKCIVCDEKFSIWRICSNHLWKCHKIDMGLLSCPMCNNFKSNSPSKVMNHMALHSEEKPFLCSDCGKGFKSLVQLRNHEVQHKKSENLPAWSTTKWCDICERFFANSKSLKVHIQSVHEHFKPFICNICGHKTSRKAMLKVHMRQHTGSKPHKCPYCEYQTGDNNCLRKHVMKHAGMWNYKCPYCPYTCIQSSSYKRHTEHRHPEKNDTYSCPSCSYTSINFANYSAHVKRHEAAIRQRVNQQTEVNEQATNGFPSGEDLEDDETQNLFNTDPAVDETFDTGGITIPAGLEMPPGS